jgi:hypothetical protein
MFLIPPLVHGPVATPAPGRVLRVRRSASTVVRTDVLSALGDGPLGQRWPCDLPDDLAEAELVGWRMGRPPCGRAAVEDGGTSQVSLRWSSRGNGGAGKCAGSGLASGSLNDGEGVLSCGRTRGCS